MLASLLRGCRKPSACPYVLLFYFITPASLAPPRAFSETQLWEGREKKLVVLLLVKVISPTVLQHPNCPAGPTHLLSPVIPISKGYYNEAGHILCRSRDSIRYTPSPPSPPPLSSFLLWPPIDRLIRNEAVLHTLS